MKTKEELNAIKEEVEAINKKLKELTEDELKEVIGGSDYEHREVIGHLYYDDVIDPKHVITVLP